MKNNKHFFNWQGNHLTWQDYFPWLFLGIAFAMILALFLTKNLIKARFSKNGKFLIFKTDVALWRTIGIIGLTFNAFKTIMFAVNFYPFYWNIFNFHICRIHIMILFTLMIIGKFKWVKYITYVSVFASLSGLYFGTEISQIVNDNANSGLTWEQIVNANPDYKPQFLDQLIYKDGFTYYNVGYDNWWLYDFVLAHLAIIFFPIFIRIAYSLKFSIKELNIMIISYISAFLLIWVTNALTNEFVKDPHWKMNNWYVGMKNVNDYTESWGVLSGWPQNLFSYTTMSIFVIYSAHFLWMYLDKFHFFINGKIVIIKKSYHWVEYKKNNIYIKSLIKNNKYLRKNF